MMDTPFMDTIATGLANHGIQVSRFEFPYMAKRRLDGKRRGPDTQKVLLTTWRDIIAALAGDTPLFIGGKSMGGRMASLVADEPGVAGVVCLDYPFHPPGKPDNLRTDHLETMPRPTLIVQGERDTFGRQEEVAAYPLAHTIQLVWVPDGDHSLKPRKTSGRTEAENLQLAVDAVVAFITEHARSRAQLS
jgi:predicted alpha/beta-hydrolase family hydrolase